MFERLAFCLFAACFTIIQSDTAASQDITINVCNQTAKNIRLAYSYTRSANNRGQINTYSRGWILIPSGDCADVESGFSGLTFYAYRPEDNVVWQGDRDDTAYCVTNVDFNLFNHGPLPLPRPGAPARPDAENCNGAPPNAVTRRFKVIERTSDEIVREGDVFKYTITRTNETPKPKKIFEATCVNVKSQGGFVSKTLQELVASREAESIGAAICSYYSGQPAACLRTAREGTRIVNRLTRAGGSDFYGEISAQPGYEICKASWHVEDWSVTERTTFATRLDPSPSGVKLWYLVSLPVGRRVRDWVNVKVILEVVPVGTRERNGCWPAGAVPWHCKGQACSAEMPGTRVSMPVVTGHGVCIRG
jgi:uncharacterized membrane protein